MNPHTFLSVVVLCITFFFWLVVRFTKIWFFLGCLVSLICGLMTPASKLCLHRMYCYKKVAVLSNPLALESIFFVRNQLSQT